MTPDPHDDLAGYSAEERRIIQASQCVSQARFDRKCWEAINFLSSYAQSLRDRGIAKGKDPNERIPSFFEILSSGSCCSNSEPNELQMSMREMDRLFDTVMRGALERKIGFRETLDYIERNNRSIWIFTATRHHHEAAEHIIKDRDEEVSFQKQHPRTLQGPHQETVGDTIFEDASLASRIVFTGISIEIFRKTGDAIEWRFREGWCDRDDGIERRQFNVVNGSIDYRSNPRQDWMSTTDIDFETLKQFFWTLESLSM